jgi:hypothetical protein
MRSAVGISGIYSGEDVKKSLTPKATTADFIRERIHNPTYAFS